MVDKTKLDDDLQGKTVDSTHYYGKIGSLMYLASSRPDLVFIVCMCTRYQARPTEKHLHAVKRIFRYLRGTTDMGLWYSKDTSIALTAYANVDHASKKALLSLVQRHNTLPYLDVVLIKAYRRPVSLYQEQFENGMIELYFFRIEYQLAAIFTKALPRERFQFLINKLRMKSMSPEILRSLAEENEE
ncbi:hypothetical protein Tco_1107678 [Tanacetum coccineum]